MLTTTSDYDTAVKAGHRLDRRSLNVDWDDDGDFTGTIDDVSRFVQSITVDRALTTDLPEQARLVTGYAAAKLTAQLTGDPKDQTKPAMVLWSPYNSDSDYYGKTRVGADVVAKLGLSTASGDETFSVFTGLTTKLGLSRGRGTATLEALDGAENLRGAVMLPQMVASDPDTVGTPGLNSQHIVERILAVGGYHAVPPARTDAVLRATLHGSAYPTVGTLTDTSPGTDQPGALLQYAQGKFGLALSAFPGGFSTATYTLDDAGIEDGDGLLIELWIARPAADASLDAVSATGTGADFRSWNFTLGSDGVVSFSAQRGTSGTEATVTGSDAIPDDGEQHYVAVYAEFGTTTVDATFNVDGTTSTDSGTLDDNTLSAEPKYTVDVLTDDAGLMEGVQVATGVRATVDFNDAWTPTAVLESGLSDLTAVPTVPDTDAWTLLQQVVAAEYGTVFFDGSGVATFWNAKHWRTADDALTVQRTLTATDSILDLETVELADQVVNHVRVPVSPLVVAAAGVVWSLSTVESVAAGVTATFWADSQGDQFWDLDTTTKVIPSGGAAADGNSGYRAARRKDGSGGEVKNLTMSVTPFATTAKITVQNPNPWPVWLVSPQGSTYPDASDGRPALELVGTKITSAVTPLDTTTVDPRLNAGVVVESKLSGLDPQEERLFSAPSSPWMQSAESAQTISDLLLDALSRPTAQVQNLTILADPALQLGDRVQLTDSTGTQLDDPFWVVGYTVSYSASGGMTMSVTLRPVAAPGQWIWGVEGRDLMGVTPW